MQTMLPTIISNLILVILLIGSCSSSKCSLSAGTVYEIQVKFESVMVYELFTFWPNSLVTIVHNTESGYLPRETAVKPYTASIGQWKCVGNNTVEIKSANYNMRSSTTNKSSLSTNTYRLTFSEDDETAQGTDTYAPYPLSEQPTDPNAKPLHGPAKTFPLTARKYHFF